MAYAGVAVRRGIRKERFEVRDASDGLFHREAPVRGERDARRIITPVFETLQAVYDDALRPAFAYVADNSAHCKLLLCLSAA